MRAVVLLSYEVQPYHRRDAHRPRDLRSWKIGGRRSLSERGGADVNSVLRAALNPVEPFPNFVRGQDLRPHPG